MGTEVIGLEPIRVVWVLHGSNLNAFDCSRKYLNVPTDKLWNAGNLWSDADTPFFLSSMTAPYRPRHEDMDTTSLRPLKFRKVAVLPGVIPTHLMVGVGVVPDAPCHY